MTILLISIIIIFLLILAIDIIPQFNTWQSRIGIGRQKSDLEWNDRLLAVSKKWLLDTPVIKLTDNSRLIIIDMLRGNYKRSAIQYWQQAALLLGLTEYQKNSNDRAMRKTISDFLESKIANDGNWKNPPLEVDGAILAYAMLRAVDFEHDKAKPAFDHIYKVILELRGDDGTIAYRKRSMHLRYVDTIGFICPFLMEYGIRFNIPEAVGLAVHQISEFNKNGMLHNHFIPCHAYNLSSGLPLGLFGWGRGLGWYAIGLIDSWRALPESHPQKALLQGYVSKFAEMAVKFQKKNGSFGWLVTSPASQSDSSATATLAWFFANAASITEISAMSHQAKDRAMDYLRSVTRRNGAVDFSQGDTKAIGVHSMHFDILPFTQGFTLRTANLQHDTQ